MQDTEGLAAEIPSLLFVRAHTHKAPARALPVESATVAAMATLS